LFNEEFLAKYYLADHIKEDKMGDACAMYGEKKNA